MNLTFAQVMNTFHHLMDLWINNSFDKEQGISICRIIRKINWEQFVVFNWLKVVLFFWLPVHTLVFLLPANIRVIIAAFCLIVLVLILSFAAKKRQMVRKPEL